MEEGHTGEWAAFGIRRHTVADLWRRPCAGIAHADYKVAFEVDRFDESAREGWSVLIWGPAHHLDSENERAAALAADVDPWPAGEKDHFIRITPARITGRRIRQA
ncbi:MAG TPA: pyridoxamine 5'-phosphate oxidase family protein [Streptosporangiaceae bacterium]|jgi:hypothetical protein